MATARLVVVLLVLGAVLLLAIQNTAPALPLVFLGGRTLALPLGVWLAAAIGLGALTTLVLTALLKSTGRPGQGRRRYQYEPQAFYEPAPRDRNPGQDATVSAAAAAGRSATTDYQARSSRPRPDAPPRSTPAADSGGEWQAWTNLQSPSQWDNWETVGQTPRPEASPTSSPTPGSTSESTGVTGWFSRKPKVDPTQQVNESLQELSQDWGDLERRPYRTPGVSPVDDSLEELTQGWDDIETPASPPPPRDFEVPQSPTQVYRDGSIYSYSYRDRAAPGHTDNIYAPPDQDFEEGSFDQDNPSDPEPYRQDEAFSSSQPEPYSPPSLDHNSLDRATIDDDTVVDADYRVIIPPYSAPSTETSDDTPWDDDDWETPTP
jgi:uncharacterized integral membrane protein